MKSIQQILFTGILVLAWLSVLPDLYAQRANQNNNNRTAGNRAGGNRTGGNRANGGGATAGSSASDTRTYRNNTQLGDAIISVDPESRSLVITADEATHETISGLIKSLDKPKPQVLIRVLFLEVTHNKDLDVGIEGKYTFRNDGKGTLETALGLAQELQGGFWRVLVDDWSVTLRAIAQQGKLEVLSRPAILARNNQEAVIVVGDEVPFITNSRISDTGQTLNTIQYQDVGIILRVTPFITTEGTIEMIVAPEISTLTEQTVQVSETVRAPVIAKRSAETVVVTPDSTTVVIGGLMENKKTDAVNKIPLLGDIPLLGYLFRRTIQSNTKKELLIFLTPTIIDNPQKLASASRLETKDNDMARKAFKKEDLDKFIPQYPLKDDPALRDQEKTEKPPKAIMAKPADDL